MVTMFTYVHYITVAIMICYIIVSRKRALFQATVFVSQRIICGQNGHLQKENTTYYKFKQVAIFMQIAMFMQSAMYNSHFESLTRQ